MPLPSRKKGEEKSKFVSRCMGDPKVNSEFPDQKQRAAVCNSRACRERVSFTDNEVSALAANMPIGNRGAPLGKVPKKKKRPKDKFRLVNDDEAGSSVTGKKKSDKKKKKQGDKSY